jgi:hypothetical protein
MKEKGVDFDATVAYFQIRDILKEKLEEQANKWVQKTISNAEKEAELKIEEAISSAEKKAELKIEAAISNAKMEAELKIEEAISDAEKKAELKIEAAISNAKMEAEQRIKETISKSEEEVKLLKVQLQEEKIKADQLVSKIKNDASAHVLRVKKLEGEMFNRKKKEHDVEVEELREQIIAKNSTILKLKQKVRAIEAVEERKNSPEDNLFSSREKKSTNQLMDQLSEFEMGMDLKSEKGEIDDQSSILNQSRTSSEMVSESIDGEGSKSVHPIYKPMTSKGSKQKFATFKKSKDGKKFIRIVKSFQKSSHTKKVAPREVSKGMDVTGSENMKKEEEDQDANL